MLVILISIPGWIPEHRNILKVISRHICVKPTGAADTFTLSDLFRRLSSVSLTDSLITLFGKCVYTIHGAGVQVQFFKNARGRDPRTKTDETLFSYLL